MRKLYRHNKTGEFIFVLFDIYFIKDGICGVDGRCKAIKHYQTLTTQYKPNHTTIDNLLKNYTLVDNPDKEQEKQLNYIINAV